MPTNTAPLVLIGRSSKSFDAPDGVEHQSGEELGIEIGALRRHGFEVRGDAFDMAHARPGHQAGQVAGARRHVGKDLTDRMNVADHLRTSLCTSSSRSST